MRNESAPGVPAGLRVGSAPSAPLNVARPKAVLIRGPLVMTANALTNEAVPAIGLAYVAGYVKSRGYEPVFLDSIGLALNRTYPLEKYPGFWCQGLTVEEILEHIPFDAGVIGFSLMFSGEWPVHRDLIAAVRERFPAALLVGGGEHASALPEFVLRNSKLDVCVLGEGEEAFFELLEARREGRDFTQIPNLAFPDGKGGFVRTTSANARILDIDNIGWPWWPEGYLEAFWQAGKSYGVQTKRDVPLMISRGCPFRCAFCSSPQMWTTRYVLRSVDDVLSEMHHYIDRFGATAFQLYDLTAITKRSWVIDLGRRMLAEGIRVRWSLPSGTRSEALDDEVLALLKATGCNYLVYAPESGSQRTLDAINKRVSLPALVRSVKSAKRLGLVLRCNLIIGFPAETRRAVFETVRFGLYLAALGVDEVSINIFSPYPGSALFDEIHGKQALTLDDAYFLSLTSLNSDYTRFQPITFNPNMPAAELAFYRLFFMASNYLLGYLLYPSRILRTIRSVLIGGGEAATVLDHRLKDGLARRRKRKQNQAEE
jgi:radical SAM superfamily enzyme YgiQ (UPF0313 family)